MDRAAAEEKRRKATAILAAADGKKRPSSASDEQASDPKRLKLEQDTSAASASFLAGFDFTSLPSYLITELIVANIEAFTEPALIALVQSYRQSRGVPSSLPVPTTVSAPESSAPGSTATASIATSTTPPLVKDEPVDPLQMDIDEEEIEYEPDRINLEASHRCFSFGPY
jgi:symplekin